MDPASAAITFGGAALAAAKFAKELNRAYVHFKMFDDDIENLATEFDVFADTVETFRFSFKCVCEEHPTLTVLGWITKQGLVSNKIWWSYRHKEDIEKLKPQMHMLGQYLSLVYDALQLNITMAMGTTPQLKEKIRRLKRIIKRKEQTIKNLRLRHEVKQSTDASPQSTAGLEAEGHDTTEMLLELGQSLRRSETVEDIVPQLSQAIPRTRPSRRQPDTDTRNSNPDPVDPSLRPPQLRRRRPMTMNIPEESARRPEPQITIPERAGQQPVDYTIEEQQRHVQEEEVHPDTPVSARSSLLTRNTSSSSAPRTITPETPITPIVQVPAASSFEDVRERRNYHTLVGLQSEAIQGYIGQPPHLGAAQAAKSVTARRFGADLHENFIGERTARELGLEIQPLEQEMEGDGSGEMMVLVVPEGDRLVHKQAVGTVEAVWCATRPQSGFRLRMWALEGALPDGIGIALGRPYEKRRRHYNSVVGPQ